MSSFTTFRLLLLVALTSYCSCKSQIETSKYLSIRVPSCLVSSQITKELAKDDKSLFGPENININGESYQISTIKKSVYNYDKQGRILIEYNQYPFGKYDSVYYQYMTTSVIKNTINLSTTNKSSQTELIALNNQNLALVQNYDYKVTYDKDGYLTSYKGDLETATKIVNGNIIESLFVPSASTPSYLTKNEYNLDISGLMPLPTFYGYSSRNLLIRSTIDRIGPSNYVTPMVYTREYSYKFDNNGRVIRQILRGKDGETPYEFGGNYIRVIDYSYICH